MAAALTAVRLADAESRADLATYVARARALDGDGAMRLQADGTALAAYVAVFAGSGMMGEGSVTGLRVLPLAEPASLDTTVSLAALGDRLARQVSVAGSAERLDVPPVTVHAGWAALSPPRSGWQHAGRIPAAVLEDVARQGIAEVAEGSGSQSGAHAVSALREAVWSRPVDVGRLPGAMPVAPVRAGAAFAAYALGFLATQGAVDVLRNGRWLRLSAPGGHVLVR